MDYEQMQEEVIRVKKALGLTRSTKLMNDYSKYLKRLKKDIREYERLVHTQRNK